MARVSNVVLLNQHPVEQALLRYFLSSEGVASSSLSPRAGLEALAAMAPDLVIADAGGTQGCAQLRERLPEACIVALAEANEVQGAHAVLRRPLDFHRLNRDLRPLLEAGADRGSIAVQAASGSRPGRAARPPHVLLVDHDLDLLEYCRAVLAVGGATSCRRAAPTIWSSSTSPSRASTVASCSATSRPPCATARRSSTSSPPAPTGLSASWRSVVAPTDS